MRLSRRCLAGLISLCCEVVESRLGLGLDLRGWASYLDYSVESGSACLVGRVRFIKLYSVRTIIEEKLWCGEQAISIKKIKKKRYQTFSSVPQIAHHRRVAPMH